MNTTERLKELLELKDAEIERLQDELSKAEDRREKDWEWAEHVDLGETYRPELPIPRLEMEWKKDGDTWQSCTCLYHLIYRHMLGHVVAVPFGRTETNSSGDYSPADDRMNGGNIRTPFRDGCHIAHDAESMKLPAFVICEDRINTIRMMDGKIKQERFTPMNPASTPCPLSGEGDR